MMKGPTQRSDFALAAAVIAVGFGIEGCAAGGDPDIEFPVQPEVFIDEFDAAEGIAFNGEGDLFIAANRAVWRADPSGAVTRLTDVFSNLGLAGFGERDLLMADFGPTNATADSSENDGIIWLISPEGEKREVVRGIADPNFVFVRDDGTFLVSDDFTENIYVADTTGAVRVWSTAVPYPNGLVSSSDGSTLYVAQIFSQLDPIVLTDRVWALPMAGGEPTGEPLLLAETGGAGVDGLALDEQGRVYVADNNAGKIWRIDPESGDLVLIAEAMPNIASLVFGEGRFDRRALYVTSTFRGGGTIWKVPVGVRGASVLR
jgi:sugar lactone lactonase YvrE